MNHSVAEHLFASHEGLGSSMLLEYRLHVKCVGYNQKLPHRYHVSVFS
jgi:hypothetical protein